MIVASADNKSMLEPNNESCVHWVGSSGAINRKHKEPDMTNFRICGLVVAAATLLLASVAQAAVVVAPLESGTAITKAAQGCGPGGWRGPYGRCNYGPARRCWRGPYGGVHCG
jgi:hypothetical protein